jgi:UDP-4-amino-4,6-dideoxy-N-acetyl-beta-L-altrosamine transaminase
MGEIIPYGRQSITTEDIEAVVETLQSDYLTQGPKVSEFEGAFSGYTGAKYCVAVSNATAALHLSVLALDLKPGERVITTPITFAATANCVRYAGGEVWFSDIDPETYLLDINKVRQLIESKQKDFFKGIIPVDFAGLPVNTEAFRELAEEHNLWVIEDACHAPGASFIDSKGEKIVAGNSKYSDVTVFSFHPVKHIACGEGGMVCTNNEALYKKILSLRSHGISKDNLSENHGGWYYEMKELGYNYRLTDIQAALGITQLKKNSVGVNRRNEIANRYKGAFFNKIKFQSLPDGALNAHHLFVIEVNDRKGLYDYLRLNNIYSQVHYIPVHTLPYYKDIGVVEKSLERAEMYYSKCLSLPMFPSLLDSEVDYVIEKVLTYSGK